MSHLPYLYSETNTRRGSNKDPTDHPVRFGSDQPPVSDQPPGSFVQLTGATIRLGQHAGEIPGCVAVLVV